MTDSPMPTPPPEPADLATPRAPHGRGLKIAIGAGGVLLAAGLWLVTLIPGWLLREPAAEAPAATPEASTARRIQATLFYLSDDGSELVPVTREVPYGATPAEQARLILDAQLRAPDGYASAIPAGTTVRAVFLSTKGDAYVDLSPEATIGHKGGTLDEALAVFAIVNAVTTNLPTVPAVQILIDGKEVDSLAGHIDLREPLARSETWVRKGQ